MPFSGLVLISAIIYLFVLFLVAYWVDQHAHVKWVQNPYVYTLSIAVFCTSWTFYGSVGRAATTGASFLAIYLGPILMFSLGYYVLRKILRICHQQHITSISDFISARYGGSRILAGLVSIIAVIGIMPYISLQLKAVASSYDLIGQYSNSQMIITNLFPHQTEFVTAVLLALFAILFGTRKIDVTEQHRGMVGAVALESLVKLVAFLAVGIYVSFGLFDGVEDILRKASNNPDLAQLSDIGRAFMSQDWWILTALSMTAIICLPRQFQIIMVENVDENYLKQAAWLFPLYLVLINIFVIPIAMAGRITFGTENISPDTYVLALPMFAEQSLLTILVFIGGLSAATGMVIVASITLSTMICNDLVVPLLLRDKLKKIGDDFEITNTLKIIRRIAIAVILLLGYLYVVLIGDSHMLVSIGLISFAAAAQFFPAIIVGLYWQKSSRLGAILGLASGFLIWIYTLLLPSFVKSGWLNSELISTGPFSIEILNPIALFGISGLGTISHGLFWSLSINFGVLFLVSYFSKMSQEEQQNALKFTHVFQSPLRKKDDLERHTPLLVSDLRNLAIQFAGTEKVDSAITLHMEQFHGGQEVPIFADMSLKNLTERLLTGVIGAASAKIVVSGLEHRSRNKNIQVQKILDDASDAIAENFSLLHGAIENVDQGIIILDKSGRFLLWNKRFCELYEFPVDMLQVGTSLESILRHAGRCGRFHGDEIRQHLDCLQMVEKFNFEHQPTPELSIEIRGNPMPKGGFVITYTDISEQKQVEATIRKINESLEIRVEERTQEIQLANRALENSLQQLKDTQKQLVQSEKLAALGQLVAGVAHEINTPIGVCVTAVSFLADKTEYIQQQHELKKLSAKDFEEFMESCHSSLNYASKNLQRAGNLVSSFKQLSVDEYSEEQHSINLYRHIEGIVLHLTPHLDEVRPQLFINGQKEFQFYTYPGIISQIFTSLILNSLGHGFEMLDTEQGVISINFETKSNLLWIEYKDNGKGMEQEQVEKIFEPFYTTTREKGDVGLGMHIVFNLVTQLLGGTITCQSEPGQGAIFTMQIPLDKSN